jgi:crotonobetainyl-CoA:carnitine CoA-transferase CaiB-like acyl-CoA transferase
VLVERGARRYSPGADAMTHPAELDMPLAGATVAVGEGLAAAVAAWWCGTLGARVCVADRETWSTGAFATRTPNVTTVAARDLPSDVVSIGRPIAELSRPVVVLTEPPGEGDERWRAMALWARSGLASITRGVWSGEMVGRPQVPMVPVAASIAGSVAAVAAIALLLDNSDGNPPPSHVEIDELECLSLLPMQPVAVAQLSPANEFDTYDVGIYEAKDGLVYIRAVEPAQWQGLLATVPGLEDVAASVMDDPKILRRESTRIDEELSRWVREQRANDVVDIGQGARAPIAAIVRPGDVLADRQLVARSFAREVGGTHSVRAPWLVTDRSAPARERAKTEVALRPPSSLPLAGLRVLDLSWAWAGPFATTLLADLGAEVINVEWRPRPSNLRVQPPFAGVRGDDSGAWWSANQRNKFSIAVDLRSAVGRKVVYELAAISDIALENFSAGVVDRLGVGFVDLAAHNGRLVYVSMSAYGESGPSAHFVGYGTQLYAAAGFGYLTSPDGSTPSVMGIPIPDPISGIAAAIAAVAHFYAARRSGRGIHVDVSELEATCVCLLEGLIGDRAGAGYETVARDGRWVIRREGHEAPVATIGESLSDPWLTSREFWMDDPRLSATAPGLQMAGPPFVIDGRRAPVFRGAPTLFSDTRLVLGQLLGWDEGQINDVCEHAGLH